MTPLRDFPQALPINLIPQEFRDALGSGEFQGELFLPNCWDHKEQAEKGKEPARFQGGEGREQRSPTRAG